MVSCELNLSESSGFPSSSKVSTFSDFSIPLSDNDNKFSVILPNAIAMSWYRLFCLKYDKAFYNVLVRTTLNMSAITQFELDSHY